MRSWTASSEPVQEQPAPRALVGGGTAVELAPARRPSGPAAAVVLAAGAACFVLGLLSVLTAASASITDALTLSDRVGGASGLSTATALTFLVTWGGLAVVWRRADPPLARVAIVSGALIVCGLVGTFPPVFNAVG